VPYLHHLRIREFPEAVAATQDHNADNSIGGYFYNFI
jgi:hypothetical protein